MVPSLFNSSKLQILNLHSESPIYVFRNKRSFVLDFLFVFSFFIRGLRTKQITNIAYQSIEKYYKIVIM
jgi:hypothetical protein